MGGLGSAWADSAGARVLHLNRLLAPFIGARDAVIVCGDDGSTLAAIHEDRLLTPASILKVLTSLAAIHYLGPHYRFPTDFFTSPEGDLKIKGFGDPLLVSENVDAIVRYLAGKINRVQNLVLDDSHFAQPVLIPGRNPSLEPYDAPNGALCANFNTVHFKRHKGRWISAEPQTPLLPMVLKKIKTSGLKDGRITLAPGSSEGLRYAGELFRHFMITAGIAVHGQIIPGRINPQTDTLVLHHESERELTQVIFDLLAFSNNFIANQLLLAMGAQVHGPPATVEKGLSVLRLYCHAQLDLRTAEMVEASGISRQNRISARSMATILDRFYPFRRLMRQEERQFYKTGTLDGIHTRAGYLAKEDGGHYRFVIMINTPGRTTDRVMKIIEKELK